MLVETTFRIGGFALIGLAVVVTVAWLTDGDPIGTFSIAFAPAAMAVVATLFLTASREAREARSSLLREGEEGRG